MRLFFLCSIVFLAGCSRELPQGERNNFHPFGLQYAALRFESFGDTRGFEEFYEDSSGLHEAHLVHSEQLLTNGFRFNNTYTVRSIGNVTIVDSVKREEIRFIDKTTDSLFRLPPGDVPTTKQQFTNYVGTMGYSLRGDTSITAGGVTLKAQEWQLGYSHSFIFEYQGIVVGNVTDVEGHEHGIRLLSIDTIHPIDPSRFIAPHGFPVIDETRRRQ